jgi:Ulp1 family protease
MDSQSSCGMLAGVNLNLLCAQSLNQLTPIQSNGYNCGVWVLAQALAVLRGTGITNLVEKDICMLRQYLHVLVLHLPRANV